MMQQLGILIDWCNADLQGQTVGQRWCWSDRMHASYLPLVDRRVVVYLCARPRANLFGRRIGMRIMTTLTKEFGASR